MRGMNLRRILNNGRRSIPASYTNKIMKILTKNQSSVLCNHDVKWYLSDEKLWITKHNDYTDIEKSIAKSIGSFNWLYEINDTILFSKGDGKFETAIIDLSGKIKTGDLDDFLISITRKVKGELFLDEKENCNFEFSSPITYAKSSDYLISVSSNMKVEELSILFIVDDFGFIVMNNQLEGWILKNASKHICISQVCEKISDNNPELLAMYLNALNLWEANEDDDTEELKKLLESIKTKDVFSLAIKNSIMNVL